MLTDLGKALRKYRIDHALVLKQMSDALELSSGYLSGIEHGRHSPPDWFANRLAEIYSLTRSERAHFQELADQQVREVKLDVAAVSPQLRGEAVQLARTFSRMPEDKAEKLRAFLKELRTQ